MTPFNLSKYHFESPERAIIGGAIIVLVLAVRFFIRRPAAGWRSHSGAGQFSGGGRLWGRIFWSCGIFLFALQIFCLLLALANPTIPRVEQEKIFQSRERIDLLDVSASMCFRYGESNQSQGAVARDRYLQFLRLRSGKHDRVALFIFSNRTYRIRDFTTDDRLLRFSVFTTPQILSRPQNTLFADTYAACNPFKDVMWVSGEGGTELDSALRTVIEYFKNYSLPTVRDKALLIVTDAAVDRLPLNEFEELRLLKIKPYMIFIKPNRAAFEKMAADYPKDYLFRNQFANSEEMIRIFSNYGWKYYEVSDEHSLWRAYKDIDQLEGVKFKTKVLFYNESVANIPLLLALYFGFCALIIGLFYELGWGSL
jgi:hypothetical protein